MICINSPCLLCNSYRGLWLAKYHLYDHMLSLPGKQKWVTIYYRPQRSWGKVIFSEACVKNCVHKGGWYPSMPCRSPGWHPRGGWGVWPGGSPGPHLGVSRPTPGGSPGPHLGGVLQAHTPGGCIPACTETDTPPQQTATAEGGTHPTGMHSCSWRYF